MARYRGPVKKLQRRFGLLPKEDKIRGYRTKRQKRKSEYGRRLEEKQKIKFIYGVLERQFRRYVKEAFKSKGQTGIRLLQLLETRLDRVIYLAGFAKTGRMARQAITHGHVQVNGKKLSIPSYTVKQNDIITLTPKFLYNIQVREFLKEKKYIPSWL